MPDRPAAALSATARAVAALVATVALLSLGVQLWLFLSASWGGIGPLAASVQFFSYFTVLSNLLVAAVTLSAACPRDRTRWSDGEVVRGAAALYITVTGLVYATVLAPILHPQGLHWWTDVGMHYVVPPLYLAWWLLAVPHRRLRWGDLRYWVLFPIAYLLWTFARGAVVHQYPYPFVDVGLHGWAVVLRNALAMTALFLMVGVALVAVDRRMGPAKR